MPGTFTIDFQDRTRASITYEAVAPRSGDAWTEMLYHVAFCVGRALVNLELEERVEYARKFDAWVGNGFADFPVHARGRPFFDAKQLALEQTFRDGGAIDGPVQARGGRRRG